MITIKTTKLNTQKHRQIINKELDLLLKYYHKGFKGRHSLMGYTDADM